MARRDKRGVWVLIKKKEKRIRCFFFVGEAMRKKRMDSFSSLFVLLCSLFLCFFFFIFLNFYHTFSSLFHFHNFLTLQWWLGFWWVGLWCGWLSFFSFFFFYLFLWWLGFPLFRVFPSLFSHIIHYFIYSLIFFLLISL
jgi:hypothetical protein